jgi:hypothetical protein
VASLLLTCVFRQVDNGVGRIGQGEGQVAMALRLLGPHLEHLLEQVDGPLALADLLQTVSGGVSRPRRPS